MMPLVVLGLLGGHMIFIMVAITLATGDRSFAVVPDYYQKAVDYDERKALLTESAELGWQADLVPSDQLDAVGQREVVVMLRDQKGRPITDAAVRVSGYHYARAGEPVAFEAIEALPGQYVGKARVAREGFWQFEIDVQRGEQRFLSSFKQFVPPAGAKR